jgi:hypothetical protein
MTAGSPATTSLGLLIDEARGLNSLAGRSNTTGRDEGFGCR